MRIIKLWESAPGLCEEEPVLEFYPSLVKVSDATVVICSGGGYGMRGTHEGQAYAEYFNTIGMNAFVCQYRVSPHRFPLPLLDLRRSIRYVRAYADQFGIDINKVAAMGSSAGGHLSALVSTYTAPIEFEGVDEIDRQPALPDATILCYPVIRNPDETGIGHSGSFRNFLGEENQEIYRNFSCDLLVNNSTPPAFIWHTSADQGVNVINSYMYAAALRRHNIPHEMHIFPTGRHGLGLALSDPHVAQWTTLMRNWLANIGWIQ